MLTGNREEGILQVGFVGSDCSLLFCPIWSIDDLLDRPALLGPGVYVLVGEPEMPGGRLRAVVGEGGMLHERLSAHAADDRLDFVWEVLVAIGPRVMTESQRIILQRRFVDEINHAGRAVVVNPHDADRCTRNEHEAAVADRIVDDLRPWIGMAVPGLVSDVEPVRAPISARSAFLPRGVDAEALMWTDHEMRFRGAHAAARMRGRETVLVPGSTILADTRPKLRWLREKRAELVESGVLRRTNAGTYSVHAFVRFETAHEAASFVTGGAATSARLVWTPLDPA